jgi:hypothetical protein
MRSPLKLDEILNVEYSYFTPHKLPAAAVILSRKGGA